MGNGIGQKWLAVVRAGGDKHHRCFFERCQMGKMHGPVDAKWPVLTDTITSGADGPASKDPAGRMLPVEALVLRDRLGERGEELHAILDVLQVERGLGEVGAEEHPGVLVAEAG